MNYECVQICHFCIIHSCNIYSNSKDFCSDSDPLGQTVPRPKWRNTHKLSLEGITYSFLLYALCGIDSDELFRSVKVLELKEIPGNWYARLNRVLIKCLVRKNISKSITTGLHTQLWSLQLQILRIQVCIIVGMYFLWFPSFIKIKIKQNQGTSWVTRNFTPSWWNNKF